jgi:MoxR-like ATPase
VANSLARLRGQSPQQPSVGLDAAIVALSGRVRLREGSQRTAEGIITELWEEIFGRVAGDGDGVGDEGKGGAPIGATNSR